MKKNQLLIACLTLFLGGLIYLLTRSAGLIMFKWVEFLHLNGFLDALRKSFIWNNYLPNWVIFSLPGGLWMFACTSIIMIVWKNELNKQSLLWLLIMPILSILSEFTQLFHLINGTFDIIDVTIYLIGFLLPIIIYSNFKKIKISS